MVWNPGTSIGFITRPMKGQGPDYFDEILWHGKVTINTGIPKTCRLNEEVSLVIPLFSLR